MPMSAKQVYRVMLKEYPDVLDILQVCSILGVSKKTAYRIVRDGELPCIKVGREYRVPKVNVIHYLLGADEEAAADII